MKIIKTSEDASLLKTRKEIANAGCTVCPCCGESQSFLKYKGFDKGISSGTQITWTEGLFHPKHMKQDCYRCYTCGAEWRSEPYQW